MLFLGHFIQKGSELSKTDVMKGFRSIEHWDIFLYEWFDTWLMSVCLSGLHLQVFACLHVALFLRCIYFICMSVPEDMCEHSMRAGVCGGPRKVAVPETRCTDWVWATWCGVLGTELMTSKEQQVLSTTNSNLSAGWVLVFWVFSW